MTFQEDDVEVIEKDEVEGQVEQQEEKVELPEHPAGKAESRDEILESAFREGEEEGIIGELSSKEGELTLEDLKRLPGAEGYTDEQILAEWARANKAAQGEAKAEATAEAKTADATFKLPFPIYDDKGNKIEALEKISLKDLFEGKLQVGYNALGKEQRKTLTEALRNASQGHFNEQRYNGAINERNAAAQRLAEASKRITDFETWQTNMNQALTALAMGNPEPMKKIARDYAAALTAQKAEVPGMVPEATVREQARIQEAGVQFYQETVVPAAYDLANRFGAKPQEILAEIKRLVNAEGEFLTQEKFDAILHYTIPQTLETLGYKENGSAVAPVVNTNGTQQQPTNEVDSLKQQVAALQKSVADKANGKLETIKDRTKKAPPAGSGSTPGAGDSMPAFKNRAQMKAWMANDPDWAKA